MDEKYSILMSVYAGEKPEYLDAAIGSMLNQTRKADEFILVCDGSLTDGLERVIASYSSSVKIVRNGQNRGLGYSMDRGLKVCRNEWVARMDSDDIALPQRCEKQMEYVRQHKRVDVLSGVIAEFDSGATTAKAVEGEILTYRRVPLTHEKISSTMGCRNPFNHPCVMFRKSKVLESGGYRTCPFFEDYDLWVRILLCGASFANLDEVLLYMRVSGMHSRRGGPVYARALVQFRTRLYRMGILTFPQFMVTTSVRLAVSLLPNAIRKIIYNTALRNKWREQIK